MVVHFFFMHLMTRLSTDGKRDPLTAILTATLPVPEQLSKDRGENEGHSPVESGTVF